MLDLKSSSALASFGVPLLSQEGPTCRLLPGAAAPWSPALDPVSKFPAAARFVVKFPTAAEGLLLSDVRRVLQAAAR